MAEPGDHRAAAAGGRGRLRASDADREQVIDVLKDAFVQGRLTRHELDSRTGQAFGSRTYAELAALTADIPAGPAATPPRQPARAQNRTPRSHTARDVAIGSGIGLSIAAAIVLSGLLDAVALLGLLAMPIVAVALVLIVAAYCSRRQRPSRGQRPPQPGQGGQTPQVQQPGPAGHGPVPPGRRTDQTRADLRTDSSRPGRPHSSGRDARAPRGIRPVPGVV
jgi:Domain of unknown function (DUF1707)